MEFFLPAYIDPGTGSLVLQVVLGGIAGALLMLKVFGARIRALFSKKSEPAEVTNAETPEKEE